VGLSALGRGLDAWHSPAANAEVGYDLQDAAVTLRQGCTDPLLSLDINAWPAEALPLGPGASEAGIMVPQQDRDF
jgi:hypothetical protein